MVIIQDSGGAVVDDMNSTMSNNQDIFGITGNVSMSGNTSPTTTAILRNTGTKCYIMGPTWTIIIVRGWKA